MTWGQIYILAGMATMALVTLDEPRWSRSVHVALDRQGITDRRQQWVGLVFGCCVQVAAWPLSFAMLVMLWLTGTYGNEKGPMPK